MPSMATKQQDEQDQRRAATGLSIFEVLSHGSIPFSRALPERQNGNGAAKLLTAHQEGMPDARTSLSCARLVCLKPVSQIAGSQTGNPQNPCDRPLGGGRSCGLNRFSCFWESPWKAAKPQADASACGFAARRPNWTDACGNQSPPQITHFDLAAAACRCVALGQLIDQRPDCLPAGGRRD